MTKKDVTEIGKLIERAQPITFACSLPTKDGRVPVGSPVLLRVGVLTEKGRQEKGGMDRALSAAIGATKPTSLRVHRYGNPSTIDPQWPPDASIFFELGILPKRPLTDYTLPDIRRTSFESA